ncbi:MAG: hemolysin family protein [Vicinamibacterales bacterium]
MIPLTLFLLACAAVYLGTIDAAFSALMRLSLRLLAERSARPGSLGEYLDDPVLLFAPVRLLLAVITAVATVLLARAFGVVGPPALVTVFACVALFIAVFQVVLPRLLVIGDPERVLEALLPSFRPIARVMGPIAHWTARAVPTRKPTPAQTDEEQDQSGEVTRAYLDTAEEKGIIEGEERRLLQSIVDFGDTLVREIMTPRPDIVAIKADASVGDLLALFREQEYSRFPVYRENLDDIAGFVFVKDLVKFPQRDDSRPITPLLRPAVVVPESKRVPELLKQFQRQQTQIAIVVDEYGGTAGLVTIEDMLEEIVGEIRDEYDVESEPIVDEGGGRFLFSGKVDIDEVVQRLGVQIEREGFETVGGYLMTHVGRVPAVGEQMDIDGLHIEVLEVDRRRVSKVRMTKKQEAALAPEGERTL